MSRPKILIYILVIVAIIAFGQYQKSQLKLAVSPVTIPPKEEVAPLVTKVNVAQETQELSEPPVSQDKNEQEIIEKVDVPKTVEVNTKTKDEAPATSPMVTNGFSKNSERIIQTSSSDTAAEIYRPQPIKETPLPEIELFMPEKANLTKEEKISEIRNLVTIFNAHLVKLYKDKEISYIPGDHKVAVLLGDSIEYYEDPVAFEKKSTSSFIKSTMDFIENVQRMRREAHQRYLRNNK